MLERSRRTNLVEIDFGFTMKESATLLCLLVAVISGATGQLRHQCLGDVNTNRNSTNCQVIEASITCLQDAIDDKVLALNTANLNIWKEDLKFFTDKKTKECSTVTTTPGATVQPRHQCLGDVGKNRNSTSCQDIDASITCLQNATDDKILASNTIFLNILQQDLKFFMDKKTKECNNGTDTGGIKPLPHQCLGQLSMNRGKTQCEDNDAWISCLQDAINDPILAANRTNLRVWRRDLKHFRRQKRKEDRCPTLKANGSCILREAELCFDGKYSPREEMCKKAPVVLNCFENLNEVCRVRSIRRHIRIFENHVQRCERMKQRECESKMRNCVQDINMLYNSENYEEAKKKVDEANVCLDNITCGGFEMMEYVKEELNNVLEEMRHRECESKIRNCIPDFQVLYDMDNYDEANRKVQEANVCLDKISCSNNETIEYTKEELNNVLEEMRNRECESKISNCVPDFQMVYDIGNYEEAKKKVIEATMCLDKISCGDNEALEDMKEQLEEALEEFNTGFLEDKCNSEFGRCARLARRLFRRYRSFEECDEYDAEEVLDCINGVSGYCQTRQQRRQVENFKEYIEEMCPGK